MALVINTNMAALSAQRHLAASQQGMAQSLQRLSSGLRINSAKDDAAGLYSAERMTSQVRGLNQAVRNASDGISLGQTAEGALDQIANNLQRVREIAVQSANATVEDRTGLQAEVDQLTREISRIIQTTEFNGSSLLSSGASLTFHVGANGVSRDQITVETTDLTAVSGSSSEYAAAQNIVNLLAAGSDAFDAMVDAGDHLAFSSPGVTWDNEFTDTDHTDADFTSSDPDGLAAIAVWDAAKAVYNDGGGRDGGVTVSQLVTAAQAVADSYQPGNATLNSYNSDLSASATVNVSSQNAAAAALSSLDEDIDTISATRATFGAVQNRFEAVIVNLSTYSENMAAARSRIMDADFAVETAALTRAQILQQAGASVLAQANTLPQAVLSLLG